jgi:hypothetical protein
MDRARPDSGLRESDEKSAASHFYSSSLRASAACACSERSKRTIGVAMASPVFLHAVLSAFHPGET